MIKTIRISMNVFGLMLVMTGLASTASAGDPPFVPANSVPELDPGSIGSALTLAAGTIVMLRGRLAAK